MTTETNDYCARLNLPTPRVEDFAGRRGIKLFDLMVVALLEHGAPLPTERLAVRLVAAGVEPAKGDMAASLQKAWHGMEPVYRDSAGRFGLNLSSSELERRLFRLRLRGGRTEPAPSALVSVADPIPDDQPLTETEVRWAFAQGSLSSVSPLRQVAAVLDAVGKPMDIPALDAYLSSLTPHRYPLREETTRGWRNASVRKNAEGMLELERSAPEVPAMRRAVRKLAVSGREQEVREEQRKRRQEAWQRESAQQREQARQSAAGLRRALLRVVPDKGPVAAAALLDIGSRTIQTFVGRQLAELAPALDAFDMVAGLWVREALQAVGVLEVDRFRLADLKPPQKTRRLNRQGRTLTITPELLISATTGISRPLGDPAKIAAYLASADDARLRRRLESDVKSLFAFYQYGRIHGCVRLRWGFLDTMLRVDWTVPGDPSLYETLKTCYQARQPVEIVWGSAPGWSNPWSRARRVTITDFDVWSFVVEGDGQQWEIPRYEMQAVRAAPEIRDDGGQTQP